jgi:hypothetical protein
MNETKTPEGILFRCFCFWPPELTYLTTHITALALRNIFQCQENELDSGYAKIMSFTYGPGL